MQDKKSLPRDEEKMIGLTVSNFEKELDSLRKEAKTNPVFRNLGKASEVVLDKLLEDAASS